MATKTLRDYCRECDIKDFEPKFNGEGIRSGSDVRRFTKRIKNRMDHFGIPESVQIAVAVTAMCGTAEDWWFDLEQKPTTWNDFTKLLTDRFTPYHYYMLEQEWKSLYHGPGEAS
ncbi:YALI0A05775p [Yarrowia lipolytica CLIB122]|uniref:YALI0A05775p n=2 Tax=Yarrowia lipolytica TaxID=4952 RepID=Q6CHS0_YARLI|nr:YALI0A05775p [Yarrowia lipolytica CLIB122]AOW00292.1 hypothetical protein YALI1_A05701g [Yarrowia lipolytica]CAG83716.1 YALI0A05775p [Yarrowia lipolytica CLIB122]|eukprot:XP_499791.1 YALI0A05775p [Yarrowia lipolytica CLIB122]